ncbi:response regulator, partial [Myxococcota bacterium]|nr:response regulator [Myxococcota bacterium]
MIKVLIVDDSKTARFGLRQAIEKDPELLVIAEAATGEEAIRLATKLDPDIVTMDVHLESENGLDITADLMATSPRPILIVTAVNPNDPNLAYQAMARGAVEVFPKLPGPRTSDYPAKVQKLNRLLKTLSKLPRKKRLRLLERVDIKSSSTPLPLQRSLAPDSAPLLARPRARSTTPPQILIIGASTGGPPRVAEILKDLKKPFPLPIIVVQHIAEGFGKGFAEWLGEVSGFKHNYVSGEAELEAGQLYVAPDNQSLILESKKLVRVTHDGGESNIVPSVDVTFKSAASVFKGAIISVLLTGMGRDGAQGSSALYSAGAITIAQDPQSCTVDSMPTSAIKAKAICEILAPEEMAGRILRLL